MMNAQFGLENGIASFMFVAVVILVDTVPTTNIRNSIIASVQ